MGFVPSRRARALLVIAALAVTAWAATPAAQASRQQPGLVSTNPANFTPNIDNGRVLGVAQVGNTIVVGGTFTSVTQNGISSPRSRLLAFDATTGVLSTTFHPVVNDTVETVAASADGTSVYVGGSFTTIDGVTRKKLVQLDVATGAVVTGFVPGGIDGRVLDMKLVRNQLYISGAFKHVAGQSRAGMASLRATTGALTTRITPTFAGVNNGGATSVDKFEVSPDQTRLVAIGNFATVNGLPRRQVAMLDISGTTSAVTTWATDRFPNVCSSSFNSYMRDLDISPDGKYFIVSTTGAYRGTTTLCDTITRWEIGATGSGQQPTWVNYTGGDTTYAVTATGSAVYAGGHFRWVNNPYASDTAGPGAVAHTGIAALDPVTGLPFSWDGERDRGVGVFDMLATDTGLWLGSDTDWFQGERRQRIAFLPLAGGTVVPPATTPSLPGTVVQLGRTGDEVAFTSLDAAGVAGATTMQPGTEAFHSARGAFVVNGTLYTAWSDGTLRARSISGTTLGAASTVELYGGTFGSDAPSVSGMFFDAGTGRLYYTLSGVAKLYWRWFNPENGLVGAERFEMAIGSLPAANVRGMFQADGWLYYANSADNALYRIAFDDGVVGAFGPGVSGTPTPVDNSRVWSAPGLTLAAP